MATNLGPLALQAVSSPLADLGRQAFEHETLREEAASDVGAGMAEVVTPLKNLALPGLRKAGFWTRAPCASLC